MDKSEIRVKTKLLAKAALRPVFFKVLFVLALEFFTELVLSLVFAKIAGKFFPSAVVRVWKYEFNLMQTVFGIVGSLFSLPLTLGAAEYLLSVVRLKPARISDIFQWFADPDRLKTVLSYFAWVAFSSVFSFLMLNLSSEYILNQLNNMLADLNGQIQSGSVELRRIFRFWTRKGYLFPPRSSLCTLYCPQDLC